MVKVKNNVPHSLSEYVGLVETLQQKAKGPLWFRGIGNSNYELIPSLYRHKNIKGISKLMKLEYDLLTRFRQRSMPFHNKSLSDDWESLFFMQHYGVPTRLLDWTENPFIAFYFAVMSATPSLTKRAVTYKNSACVWVLDPVKWNRHALKHVSFDGGILTTSDEQIVSYKPTAKFNTMTNFPVAIYGTHNSARIVAQRGVFTIFGESTCSMENSYNSDSFPTDSLTQLIIKAEILHEMRRSILDNGITESVVFPDLDGLASEMKRQFSFED